MDGKLVLPERIGSLVANKGFAADDIGMSGSSVLIYENMVLKIQEHNEEAENEYGMLQFLKGKLPVPEVYAYETAGGKAYLLMGRCRGEMSCARIYMEDPFLQCRLLAEGLKGLWSVDISACPFDQRLEYKLARAEHNIKNNLVDLENVEAGTFGENGFRDPASLLQWLYENKPVEEPVMSHGDYCLPNLFGTGDKAAGYIDLGRAGIADKWCDIAICYRSLRDNYSGKYSRAHQDRRAGAADCDASLLFRELGLEPDWEKINYYILLDELF